MNLGWCDVCLKVGNVSESTAFYQKLGFRAVEGNLEEGWTVITNGDLRLGLYERQYMNENTVTLNFRGGDVLAIAENLQKQGCIFEKGPTRGASGGCSATLKDPDGYALFFDTAPGETKREQG